MIWRAQDASFVVENHGLLPVPGSSLISVVSCLLGYQEHPGPSNTHFLGLALDR